MNNTMIIGRYYNANSIIHKLDARTKLISLILIMVGMFLIPFETKIPYLSFIIMGCFFVMLVIIMLLSKISIFEFIKSYKQILFLIIFSFAIQLLFNKGASKEVLYTINFNFTLINIIIVIFAFVVFLVIRRFIKFKLILLTLLIVGSIILCQYPILDKPFNLTPSLNLYKYGLEFGIFTVARVIIIISFSTILTLTTKPIDISNAIEWLLKPLELIKIKTSVFAMMLSIALRFIPTLFNETEKILKAQASRGVDFKESSLGKQIIQIVSLLIPMFVISIKRASDLADAMEARGYVPGEKRTKLLKMKFRVFDYFGLIISISILIFGICSRIFL